MKRFLLVSCVVLLATGAMAYVLLLDRQRAGATLETPAACRLLPNGKQWVYQFRQPSDSNPGYGYGLQIRRTSKARDPRYTPKMTTGNDWVSKDAAEAVLASGSAVSEKWRDGLLAFQILDVRDFAVNECTNPLRVFGGVQLPGVSTTIARDTDFLLGDRIEGTTVNGTCDWKGHELCPLQFQTSNEARVYHYDVVLVADPKPATP
jgi:hypothetical protein